MKWHIAGLMLVMGVSACNTEALPACVDCVLLDTVIFDPASVLNTTSTLTVKIVLSLSELPLTTITEVSIFGIADISGVDGWSVGLSGTTLRALAYQQNGGPGLDIEVKLPIWIKTSCDPIGRQIGEYVVLVDALEGWQASELTLSTDYPMDLEYLPSVAGYSAMVTVSSTDPFAAGQLISLGGAQTWSASSATLSGDSEAYAVVSWTPPTTQGEYVITAMGGGVTVFETVFVAGRPVVTPTETTIPKNTSQIIRFESRYGQLAACYANATEQGAFSELNGSSVLTDVVTPSSPVQEFRIAVDPQATTGQKLTLNCMDDYQQVGTATLTVGEPLIWTLATVPSLMIEYPFSGVNYLPLDKSASARLVVLVDDPDAEGQSVSLSTSSITASPTILELVDEPIDSANLTWAEASLSSSGQQGSFPVVVVVGGQTVLDEVYIADKPEIVPTSAVVGAGGVGVFQVTSLFGNIHGCTASVTQTGFFTDSSGHTTSVIGSIYTPNTTQEVFSFVVTDPLPSESAVLTLQCWDDYGQISSGATLTAR